VLLPTPRHTAGSVSLLVLLGVPARLLLLVAALIVAGPGRTAAWVCPVLVLRSMWGMAHCASLCVQDLCRA
jgi:hypothetical protein